MIGLFPKNLWSKDKIVNLMMQHNYNISSTELRNGFNHLVFINKNAFNFDLLRAPEKIILVDDQEFITTGQCVGYIIDKDQIIIQNFLGDLELYSPNFEFDLRVFGFHPSSNSNFKLTISRIKASTQQFTQLLQYFDCEEIIENPDISPHVKKILVDVFGLIAANFEVQMTLTMAFDKNFNLNYTKCYASILCCTFLTRAIVEKIIQLVASIDPALNYEAIQSTKSIKKTFKKNAINSSFSLTIELNDSISNIELLDDNYRTPEAHKLGRILGILNNLTSETYGTLINEVISTSNWANEFYRKICNHLKVS